MIFVYILLTFSPYYRYQYTDKNLINKVDTLEIINIK